MGNKLIDLQCVTAQLQMREETELSLTFDIESVSSDMQIKTFVWKEMYGKPLADAKSFS